MIRVLLADDENLIRGALAALLAMEDDVTVVAQAASGPEALAMGRLHRPDVALLDLQMPGLDGIAVAQALRIDVPACATVIVTSHGQPGSLRRALAAGARGFLPKTVSRRCSPTCCGRCTTAAATWTRNWPPRPSPPETAR